MADSQAMEKSNHVQNEASAASDKDFSVAASMQDGILHMELAGRIDSLHSPKFLEAFEEITSTEKPKAIHLDMKGAEYISSAGLRVMLIMFKSLKGGPMELENVAPLIKDILYQSGFDTIFKVKS